MQEISALAIRILERGPNYNPVMRIGAFPGLQMKKLPWKAPRAELIPAKASFPQRAGQSRPRPEVSSPLLPSQEGLSGGQKRRRVRFGHLTLLWELASQLPDPGVASHP